MIHVTVNGQRENIARDTVIAEMLRRLGMTDDATGIAVAVNNTVVPRSGWKTQRLQEGDVVEVIRAVQGG